jgi:hypothetical protein
LPDARAGKYPQARPEQNLLKRTHAETSCD